MKKLYALFFLCCSLYTANAQITVTTGVTPTAFINNLIGSGITVSNVTINCPSLSYGTFTGNTGTGMTSGVILTSGSAAGAAGPNSSGSFGSCSDPNFTSCADPDLTASQPQTYYDCCSVEFDIVPSCAQLSINFTFGSEEYPEFVNSSFNDAFGFFITGPNPLGGNYTSYNMAQLPNGQIVSIDNVNATTNSAYYNTNVGTALQYDGYTDGLVATVDVTPCATYHIKLIIADAGDCSYDSGVLLNYQGLACTVPPMTLTPSSTPAVCGVNNGTACVTVNGGVGPFTYSWSPGGQTTSCISGLAPGNYTVTVTDQGGCLPPQTITVTVGSSGVAPNITITPTNPTCNGSCNGTLVASATGGVSPYSYAWSGGLGTGAVKNGVCPGTYTVTVTGANGCSSTQTVTLTAPPALTLTASATPTTCFGQCNGTLTANAGGGTPGYTYSWSGGVGAGANHSGVCAGTYTVTATDANGCTTTATATVVNGPNIIPSFTYNGNQCLTGNSFNFTNTSTVTGGTGATTYNWNFGAGATPATSTATNPTGVTYSTTGTHTVTLSVTNNGCTQTVTVNVITFPVPTVNPTSTNVLCNGACNGTVNATGSSGTTPYNFNWSGGLGAGAAHAGVCPGTYTVTLTDANGCTATGNVTVTQPPALTVSASGTNVTCNGACNGTVTANASGGTAGYTYNWSGGLGTGASKSGVCAGTYTVTVTDANGCTATANVTVTQPPVLTVSASGTNVTCNGSCNGTLTANASGGTAGYTYNWSGGLGAGANQAGVCAGNYTVTVTDANGCTATANVTVTQPTALTVSANGTNVTCNGSCNGTVTAGASGGTAGYTYSWSGGLGTGANQSGVCAGTYTVTATDANGCTATANVTLTQPAALTANIAPVALACNGTCNGQATVVVAGGTTPYTYQWNNPSVSTTATTTADLCASPYTVNITDANGCTTSANVTVTQPTAITLSTSSTNTNCGGSTGTATVTASGGAGGFTYNWNPGGQTGATASGLAAGSYTVTVTDANGCTATATQAVNNNSAPVVTEVAASHVDVLCNGGSTGAASVSVSGGTPGYTFVWSPAPGGGQGTANATGLSAGSYSVTVTDANGCTGVTNITITQPAALAASASVVSNVLCNGGNTGSVSVTAGGGTPGYTYSWAPGGQTGATASGLTAGTYTVTVTDANGCTITANATVTEPTALTASATGTNISCNGGADGTINLTAGGGTAPYAYSWTGPSGFTSIAEDPAGLAAGTYNVTVTDANGCTTTATVTITEPVALTVSTTPTDAHCGLADGSAIASSAGGTGAVSFTWFSDPGFTTQIGTGANISSLAAGTYYVIATDANGCTSNTTVTIANQAGPVATASVVSNATGAGLCNGSGTVTMAGGTPPFTFAWTNGETTQTAVGLCAGNNCVTVTDANGCQSTSCITITEPGPLTVSIVGTDLLCNGVCIGTATSTVSGGVTPYTYSWSNGATTANLTGLCAGNYTLTVTDANGNTANANVTINEPTVLNAGVPAVLNATCNGVCDGGIVVAASGGTPGYTYNWTSLGAGANQSNVCAGTYNLTVTDANGCTATSVATITEPPAMSLSFTNVDANCNLADGSATVTASGGTPGYTYSWSAGSTSATQNNLGAGTYTVTVTDSKGCTVTGTVTINNNPPGVLNAVVDNNVSCFGASDGQATANLAGGAAPITYSWNTTPAQNTATATGMGPGTWTVTATDANACLVTLTVTITEPTQLTVNATFTAVTCPGGNDGTVSAVAAGGTSAAGYTYAWTDAGGGVVSTAANATGLVAGTYTITVTDDNGCTVTQTVTVTQPAALNLSVATQDVRCYNACDGNATAAMSGGTPPYAYQWNDPLLQVTPMAGNLCAGNFTVTVTDNNGCTTNANVTINQPQPLTADSTVVQSHCGQADGSACITISGGTAPYTATWPDGTTGLCHTNLTGGTYVIDIEDAEGCTLQYVVPVPDISGPSAVIIAQTNVSCYQGNDGSATVNMVGGTGIFTVLWDAAAGSQTTPTASNLAAGTYSVTITDAAGCNASASVTITEPADIVYVPTTVDPTCFSYCDGLAWVSVVGGTQPYSYNWLDVSNNPIGTNNDSLPNLCDGNYTLIMTDANGCTEIIPYTLTEPVQVTASSAFTNDPCNGSCNGTATATPLSGNAPFTFSWNDPGAQTTSTATGLCAGSYTGTVTDQAGCFTTVNVTITEPTVLDVVISAFGDVSCSGFCDGFAQATASGGTPPYNYSWSNGGGLQTNNNICTGTYIITVTDANGCQDTASVVISTPNPLNVSVSGVDLTCYQQCIGSVSSTVSGGTTPYALQWDDPNFSTTPGVNNLCAGTYTLVVNDANGCNVTQSITLTEPAQLDFTVSAQDAFCQQPNGQICITPMGGVPPLNILWNDPNAQTTSCAFNLLAGCFTATVTDANGCVKDSLLCINDIAGPTVTLTSFTDVTCSGANDGSITWNPAGGTGNLNIDWQDGSGNPIPSLSGLPSSSTLSGGTYGVIVTDSAGCVATLTQFINEPNGLVAAVTASTNALCFGSCDGTATVSSSGGNGGNVITWSSGAAPGNATNTGLCAGIHTVTVTDVNGCSDTDSITINEPTQLTASVLNFTNVSCNGFCDGQVTLTTGGATPPYSYTWTGNVSSGPGAVALCPGTYNVDVTDANGCQVSTSQVITEPPAMTIATTTQDETCSQCNGAAQTNVNGGTLPYTWSWPVGATPTQSSNTSICNGTYTVTVTDANGCVITDNVVINDQAGPTISQVTFTQPLCNGQSNGTTTVTYVGGTAPIQFLWNDPNAQTTQTASGLAAGSYCVALTDANGCIASQCATVTEPSVLSGVADLDVTICYGDSTQVWGSGSGGTPPYTVNWTTPGLTGAGPIMVYPLTTTTYCMEVTDANGCLSPQDCATITVNPPLSMTVSAVPSTICAGDVSDLTANASGGNGGPYTFNWVDGSGNTVNATTNGATSTAQVTPVVTTMYIVTLDDGCSIPYMDSVQVMVNPVPQGFVNVVDPDGCAAHTAQFVLNTDIGVTFGYDFTCDGTIDLNTTNPSASYTYNLPGTYDVCVTFVSQEGCTTVISMPNMITVYPVPVAGFIPDPDSTTTIMTPSFTFSETATGEISYIWDFGDGSGINGSGPIPTGTNNGMTSGTFEMPQHMYPDTGWYQVMQVVVSADGCTDTAWHQVYVEGEFALYVPNAFTPNGDGLNDVFQPLGIGWDWEFYQLYVFDRWGEVIYDSQVPTKGWDGTHKGQKCKTDVYVWKLIVRDADHIDHSFYGHVTLLRGQ